MVSVNMREMLEAGVHFGHQVRKWNPKMKPYIYGKKNGIYIINLQTSIEMFKSALKFVSDVVASGKEALIVGTKKQAQAIITEISEDTGMHYVNKRWLGGLLTNFPTVKKSIEKLLELDEMKKDGRWEVKSKKEQSKLEKIFKKLHKNLWGVRNIKELPGVIIVIDSYFENIAVYEGNKLNIPLVAIVDTNANPEEITYPVPGNDDAIRSIKLFTSKFGEAVKLGMERRLSDSLNQEAAAPEEEGAPADEGTETAAEAVEIPETKVNKEATPVAEPETPKDEAAAVIETEKLKKPEEIKKETESKPTEAAAEEKEVKEPAKPEKKAKIKEVKKEESKKKAGEKSAEPEKKAVVKKETKKTAKKETKPAESKKDKPATKKKAPAKEAKETATEKPKAKKKEPEKKEPLLENSEAKKES